MRNKSWPPINEYFWTKVDKSDPDGCWIWELGRTRDGYGVFNGPGRRQFRAHRFAYELTHGSIAKGLFVCHRCDNPPCVRPDHLFAATHQENQRDAAAKGRSPFQVHPEIRCVLSGDAHPQAKLHREDLPVIRERRARGETLNALAREFGVSRTAITRAITGVSWK